MLEVSSIHKCEGTLCSWLSTCIHNCEKCCPWRFHKVCVKPRRNQAKVSQNSELLVHVEILWPKVCFWKFRFLRRIDLLWLTFAENVVVVCRVLYRQADIHQCMSWLALTLLQQKYTRTYCKLPLSDYHTPAVNSFLTLMSTTCVSVVCELFKCLLFSNHWVYSQHLWSWYLGTWGITKLLMDTI